MLTNDSGSYYEGFRRSKGRGRSKVEEERLLTDRSAYLSFLEVQLERVSAACLTSESFSSRLEELQGTVVTFDEKINNLVRSLRLVESSAKRQLQDHSAAFMVTEQKVDGFQNEFSRFRTELDGFEARQKELSEVIRRRVEQKVLDLQSRLELEEARGKANESKLGNLSDLTREETRNAMESMRNMVELRLEGLKDQLELKVGSLEIRLSNVINHSSSLPALQDRKVRFTQESQGFKTFQNKILELVETKVNRLASNLAKAEERFQSQTSEGSNDSKAQRLIRRMDRLELQMEEVSRENESLKQELEKAESKSQGKHLRAMLNAVEKKVSEQSQFVAESMARVEDFMELFDSTKQDLEERLRDGKKHQERLRKLLEQSAKAVEAEEAGEPAGKYGDSPFKLAFDELSEIVSSMEEVSSRKPSRGSRMRRKRSFSAEPKRRIPNSLFQSRRSSTSQYNDSESDHTSCLRRDGGGKRGRRRSSFDEDELIAEVGKECDHEPLQSTNGRKEKQARNVAGFNGRPPWNAG